MAVLYGIFAAIPAFLATPGFPAGESRTDLNGTALIDTAHGMRSGAFDRGGEGLICLLEGLPGVGLLPLISSEDLRSIPEGRRAIFHLAPELPLQSGELDALHTFMERGGLVIVTSGGDCGNGAKALLE